LYEATGVAWYYLLDTEDKQFKLPRTKYGFVGMRDSVGNYVPESVPNITGEIGAFQGTSTGNRCSGAFAYTSYTKSTYGGANNAEFANGATFNASRSSSTYKNGAPVQERATQMYLYFYVGNFEQSALEQTAGVNSELFNGKADLNLSNTASNVDFVVESQLPTSSNGYTWYRKYKSGWVEQGGYYVGVVNNSDLTIVFPIKMAESNKYTIVAGWELNTSNCWESRHAVILHDTKTSTGVKIRNARDQGNTGASMAISWQVSGRAA
jgi:hypothetical protein